MWVSKSNGSSWFMSTNGFLFLFLLVLPDSNINAFKYDLSSGGNAAPREIMSPEMLCFSGTAVRNGNHGSKSTPQKQNSKSSNPSSIYSCPVTPADVESYNGIIMDDAGYVDVILRNVKMRDDGRRRKYDSSWPEFKNNGKRERRGLEDTSEETRMETEEVVDPGMPHHLQVYLVNLDEYASVVSQSQCCYELEMENSSDSNTGVAALPSKPLPGECTTQSSSTLAAGTTLTGHDYRVSAPRLGQMATYSAPMHVNDNSPKPQPHTSTSTSSTSSKHKSSKDKSSHDSYGIDVDVRLRPTKKGRYMVVISNCAVEILRETITTTEPTTTSSFANGTTAFTPATSSSRVTTNVMPLKAVIAGDMQINFVSKFGELPMSLMGIIPFYGILSALYTLLSTVWIYRARQLQTSTRSGVNTPRSFLGGGLMELQKIVRALVFGQAAFATIAFSYYLHLNNSPVDIDELYSGTAAALVNWGPWSIAVALLHFGTILGCQVVVTLATDGTWLIQHTIRPFTRKAVMTLCGVWMLFFLSYGFITPDTKRMVFAVCGVAWIVCLLCNVQRSLRHLRTLMVGQSNDTIMAVGGALVAKRSLYRKMCAVVALYPVIFCLSFVWTSSAGEDSWAWVGFVLVDMYLFVLLAHASIIWMPRPMASQEYVKYAPLEVSASLSNDLELWEGDVNNENWDEFDNDHGSIAMT